MISFGQAILAEPSGEIAYLDPSSDQVPNDWLQASRPEI
jgi:hypothetical protein